MDIQEAWEIVSNIIDKTYTNQDYDDALEVIGQLVKEKQEREKPICVEHEKVYSPAVLLSYPPKYKWICRKCGAEGIDTIGEYADDEYERLKKERVE